MTTTVDGIIGIVTTGNVTANNIFGNVDGNNIRGDINTTGNATFAGNVSGFNVSAANQVYVGPLQLRAINANTFGVFTADGVTQANIDVGNVDASQITQGNSIIAFTGVDSNAFVQIDGNIILEITPVGTITDGTVTVNAEGSTPAVFINTADNNPLQASITTQAARGTFAAPLASQPGDQILSLQATTYTNFGVYQPAGQIQILANGPATSALTNAPSIVQILSTDNSGVKWRMQLDDNGNLILPGRVDQRLYSDIVDPSITVTSRARGNDVGNAAPIQVGDTLNRQGTVGYTGNGLITRDGITGWSFAAAARVTAVALPSSPGAYIPTDYTIESVSTANVINVFKMDNQGNFTVPGTTIYLDSPGFGLQIKAIDANTLGVFKADGVTQANIDIGNVDASQITQGNSIIAFDAVDGNAFVTIDGSNIMYVDITGVEVTGNINTTGNQIYNLGNSANQWKDLWISEIYMENIPLTMVGVGLNSNLQVNGANVLVQYANGNTTLGNAILSGNLDVNGFIAANGNIVGSNINTSGLVFATGNITGGNIITNGNVNGGNIITSGNVSGGNVLATGTIGATGNLFGGNITTNGEVTATGNVTGGNVITGGNVSAGNLSTSGQVFAIGNVTGGNVITGGNVSATGNVSAGNLTTGGEVSATGNISTSGDVSATGNISGGANLTITGNAAVGGILTDNYYYANGSPVDFEQPAGSNTQIQYNNNNDFGASSAFTFDEVANVLTISGDIDANNVAITNDLSSNTLAVTANAIVGNITTAAIVASSVANVDSLIVVTTTDIGSTLNVTDDITAGANIDLIGNLNITGNISQVTAQTARIFGDAVTGIQALRAGVITGFANLATSVIQASTNNNDYSQVNQQNVNNGAQASADYVITANDGDDTNYYLDLGLAGSGWDGTQTNSLGNALYPHDGYLYVNQGNLILGSDSATTSVKVLVGAPDVTGLVATFNAPGTDSTGTGSGALVLTGGLGVSETINSAALNTGDITAANVTMSGDINAANLTLTGTAAVTGNITGGNLITGGQVVATGNIVTSANISGGNLAISGTAVIVGNIDGGNLNTAGQVVAVGNVSGGNITTAGQVVATGNVVSSANINGVNFNASGNLVVIGNAAITGNVSGGNLTTAGEVVAVGNVSGGNITTAGQVVATGNVVSSANINGVNFNASGNLAVTGNAAITGNVAGGNITTAGQVVATGNVVSSANINGVNFNASGNMVAAGNIAATTFTGNLVGNVTATTITATGNIDGGNLNTAGQVVAVGNVSGGNITTAGQVVATGNVVSSANINGVNFNASGNMVAAGNIDATTFTGNLVGNITLPVGGNIQSPGANTQVLFNDAGNINAASGMTFVKSSDTLTVVGNVIAANMYANSGTIGASLLTGTLTTVAQPNVTSLGTLNQLVVSNTTANIISLGPLKLKAINTDTFGVFQSDGVTQANIDVGSLEVTSIVQGTSVIGIDALNGNSYITVAGSNVFLANASGIYTTGIANATGNINGANLTTPGLVAAVGNVSGGNITTLGLVAATGNVSGGNITTAGEVVAVGNISGANAVIAANVVAGNLNSDVLTSRGLDLTLEATGTDKSVILVPSGVGTVDVSSARITSLADPTNDTDAATKAYVDQFVQGILVKASVRVATTTGLPAFNYNNGAAGVGATITALAVGVLAVDGVNTVLGDRILVKSETAGLVVTNGIYVVTTEGTAGAAYVLTRSLDMDTSNEVAGAFTFVQTGATNADSGFVCTANQPVTIGTTAITWSQFSGAGSYTAGSGIALTGTQFSANVDGTTTAIIAGNIAVKNSAVLTTPNITDATGNSITLTGGNGAFTGTSMTVTGTVLAGNIYANSGTIGASLLTGTITTAAQPNITTLGSLTLLNVTGNLVAGNISSPGQATIVGNIAGGNIATVGVINATGNITGGNLVTGGILSAAGNVVSSANVNAVNVNPSGNIVVGTNAIVGGLATVTGNLTAGNLVTPNKVEAAGNIVTTGGFFVGDGRFLSNVTVTAVIGIQNGTSNVSIPVSDGNIRFNVAGLAAGNLTPTTAAFGVGAGAAGLFSTAIGASAGGSSQGAQAVALGYSAGGTGQGASAVAIGAYAGQTNQVATSIAINGSGAALNPTGPGLFIAPVRGDNANTTQVTFYNAGTGEFTYSSRMTLTGDITAGNIYANSGTIGASLLTGTLTTAAQPNITSVGTLSSLAVTANITAGNVYANAGTIGATTLLGTLGTAAQPTITSVGTLTSLAVTGNIISGNITTGNITLGAGAVLSGNGSGLTDLNGSNITTGTIAQARLANASLTLGSTVLTLGGTVTTVAGLASVTSTSFVGTLNGAATTAGTVTTAAQPNITSVGTLGSLAVTGGITSASLSSTGTVSATTLTGTLSTAAQPSITSVGTLGSLAVTGGITSASLSSTGTVSAATLTGTLSTAAQPSITSVGTLTSLNVSGTTAVGSLNTTTITAGSSGTGGTITGTWTLTAGTTLQATYSDLGERYAVDVPTQPGTVMMIGGTAEVTAATYEGRKAIAGVISTDPAYVLNSTLKDSVIIALAGRVPCKVVGKINKGDILTVSHIAGVATATNNPEYGAIVGRALASYDSNEVGVIEIKVDRG